MKIKSLQISNVGMIEDTTIELDKALILFFGEIRQGKTTILKSVQWGFGAAFPQDIIRHGQREAFVEMKFDNGLIRREWYKAKDQTTKARPIIFIRDGLTVKQPAEAIARLLNPFVLNQNFLAEMSELDRRRYFTELFAVKTDDIDRELTANEAKARDLRVRLKAFGDIDLTRHEKVDVLTLRAQLMGIRAKYEQDRSGIDAINRQAEKCESEIEATRQQAGTIDKRIGEFREALAEAEKHRATLLEHIDKIVAAKVERVAMPGPPDNSALEKAISDAAANNVRHEQYIANLGRQKELVATETRLNELETTARELRDAKIARLASLAQETGIPGLVFDESGGFTYEGASPGMLSTSQLMSLSSQLSALYPEGFSIELIDRGESLGKSILEYAKRAEDRQTTILATIVGEKIADTSEKIGVFVVKDGIVLPD